MRMHDNQSPAHVSPGKQTASAQSPLAPTQAPLNTPIVHPAITPSDQVAVVLAIESDGGPPLGWTESQVLENVTDLLGGILALAEVAIGRNSKKHNKAV